MLKDFNAPFSLMSRKTVNHKSKAKFKVNSTTAGLTNSGKLNISYNCIT